MAQPTLLEQIFNMFNNPTESSRPSVTEQAQRYRTNTTASPTGSRAVTRDKTGRVQSFFRPDLPQAVRDRLNQGEKILRERSGAGPVPRPFTVVPRPPVQSVRPEENTPGMSEFVDVPAPFPLPLPAGSPAQSEFIEGPTPLPFPTYYSPGSFINGGEEIDADNIAISMLGSNATDPARAAADAVKRDTLLGYKHGGDLAQSQKQEGLINEASDMISGLLGNVDFKGLFRVLARPEFTAPMGPGQTPVTNFIQAAAADRTAQATSAAAQQAAGLEGFKAETDRLKALMPDFSKMPKLTGEANKLYDSMAAAENTARLGKQIQESLSSSFMVSGSPGAAAEGFRAIAAMFGFDPGEMEQDEVKKRVAALKKEILQSRAFGREANKQELEILNKLVQEPDLFTSRTQILNSIKSLTESAERRRFNVAARLKAFGLPTEFNATKPEGPGFTRNN